MGKYDLWLNDIYELGGIIQDLQIAIENEEVLTVHGDDSLISVVKDIIKLLKKIDICKDIQRELGRLLKSYEENYTVQKLLTPAYKIFLSDEDYEFLKKEMHRIDIQIDEELFNKVIIVSTTEGTLHPNKLREGAIGYFEKTLWDKFEEIIQEDLEESVDSIMAQNWTAAGFMAMRAIETGLNTYYRNITKKKNTPMKTIGEILGEFKRDYSEIVSKELIGHMTYLKKIRNDLAHANKRIDHQTAEYVFLQAVNVLTEIY